MDENSVDHALLYNVVLGEAGRRDNSRRDQAVSQCVGRSAFPGGNDRGYSAPRTAVGECSARRARPVARRGWLICFTPMMTVALRGVRLEAWSAVRDLDCVKFQRHEEVVVAWLVAGERAARDEARALVQHPDRGKRGRGPGLQAHPADAPGADHLEQAGQHGPPDPAAWLSLYSWSWNNLERSAGLYVAWCRPMVAPHLAPTSGRGLVALTGSPRSVTSAGSALPWERRAELADPRVDVPNALAVVPFG